MKRPEGIIVIAIYYALMALIFLVGVCALLFAFITVVTQAGDPAGVMWGGFGVGVGLLFVLLFFVGAALAAWGLLAMKEWGRWIALAMAIIQLLGFPIFTIIGGLIIYYLLRDDVKSAFNGGMRGVREPAGPSIGGPSGTVRTYTPPAEEGTKVPLAPAAAFPVGTAPVVPETTVDLTEDVQGNYDEMEDYKGDANYRGDEVYPIEPQDIEEQHEAETEIGGITPYAPEEPPARKPEDEP